MTILRLGGRRGLSGPRVMNLGARVGLEIVSSVFSVPNTLSWPMSDNAGNTIVLGSEVNGVMNGANTSAVAGTLANGVSGFHLNGTDQYFSVAVPRIWPHARANLWTKYASNPTLPSAGFGMLFAKPGGGWYFFGAYGNVGKRWESADLITWTNETVVLGSGGVTAWDRYITVFVAFQKPDESWVALYRGSNAGGYQIGLATSADGTTWTRKDNGGVDDGLFPQFGANYDAVGVILVDTRYYVYVGGAPPGNHGSINCYYSDDDFATFTPAANNPLFAKEDSFCSGVSYIDGYYYIFPSRDFAVGGTLYDHAVAIYRSTSPLFTKATTEFLGYAIVNDQTYDAYYLDGADIPMTDVYRTTLPAQFGDTLQMFYMGFNNVSYSQSLATFPKSSLVGLPPCCGRFYDHAYSWEFWIQFDVVTANKGVYLLGSGISDVAPQAYCKVATSGANKVLALYLGGTYVNTTAPLIANTPYHVVVTDDQTTTTVYINGAACGAFTQRNANKSLAYFILGGNVGAFTDGYIGGLKMYPRCLSASEVGRLL